MDSKDKNSDSKPKTPESSETTPVPAPSVPSQPEKAVNMSPPTSAIETQETSSPKDLMVTTSTTVSATESSTISTAAVASTNTSTTTTNSTTTVTSTTSSSRPHRVPSPPKKSATGAAAVSSTSSHQLGDKSDSKVASPKTTSAEPKESAPPVSKDKEDSAVLPSTKSNTSSSEASGKTQKESDEKSDRDSVSQKSNTSASASTNSGSSSSTHAPTSTTKRPASDTSAGTSTTSESVSASTVDNSEGSGSGGDAKRRKIRRDFKFESRDPSASSTTTSESNPPHRIAFSTSSRGVVKTSLNSSKVGKPMSAASRSDNDKSSGSSANTTPSSATVAASVATVARTDMMGSTGTAAETPMEVDAVAESVVKDLKAAAAEVAMEPAEKEIKEKGKEKEIPTSEASGPKVPPIKIVLGSNGSSAVTDNDTTGSSTKEGGSPNSSFPYVVSSTTPDTAPAAAPPVPPVTSASAPIAASTTATKNESNSNKKETGPKVKLVATLGPTGGTFTYTSVASTPPATSATASVTPTSTQSTGGTNVPATIKAEPNAAGPEPAKDKEFKPALTRSDSENISSTGTPPDSSPPGPTAVNDNLNLIAATAAAKGEATKDEAKLSPASIGNVDIKATKSPDTGSTAAQNEPVEDMEISEPISAKGRDRERSASKSKSSSPVPSPAVSVSKEKDKEKEREEKDTSVAPASVSEKERAPKGMSPPIVSSTTSTTVSVPPTTTVGTAPSSTTTTTATTTTTGSASENLPKEKPHRVTRSSHRIAASTGAISTSASGNGQAPGSPATGSPKMSASASPGQPEAAVPMDTAPPANAPAAAAKGTDAVEKTDSTDSAHVDLHPRKRKIRSKEPTPTGATSNSSNSSTSGETNETAAATTTNNQTTDPPVLNCFEMYLNIRKQIEQRRKNLFPVQPKPPQGFKDYLMNRASYVLDGQANARLAVPLLNTPSSLAAQMKDTFIEQEKERHKLRLQHLVEKEKLVLSVEQEILRVHGRAARALSNQALPFSVCTILKDQEVYNLLTPEQEEKEKNARSRYNGRLFLSWLQDVDDKWDKIKESMLLRHHNEAESLAAVQRMNWEWKLKEFNLCEPKATPPIDDLHVPMVHVSDDFDLLPA